MEASVHREFPMTHRYRFDLKMFATVRLTGKNITEAWHKLETAFDLVSVEVRVGKTHLSAKANRYGSPELKGNDRWRRDGKLQVLYAFDLAFSSTIEIAAETAWTARDLIAEADITAVASLHGKRVQVETTTNGGPELLAINGADPKLIEGDLIVVGGSIWRHQEYVSEWLSQFDDSGDFPGFGD
jgi:hypothetical protein